MTTQPSPPTSALVCLPRARETSLAAAARLDPEHRYLPENLDGKPGDETKCNWAAADHCLELGVELPGQDPKARVKAREQAAWLADPARGGAKGWKKVDELEAVKAVEQGRPALVTWVNPDPTRSSHIAAGTPEIPNPRWRRFAGRLFVVTAGRQCFNNAPWPASFGNVKVDFWIND